VEADDPNHPLPVQSKGLGVAPAEGQFTPIEEESTSEMDQAAPDKQAEVTPVNMFNEC
jgi:hypothetical protein